MQNSEGVATLMQQEISDISYVVGNENTLKKMLDVPAMRIFDDKSITFLNALSTLLMKKAKGYSDVITFAFWCRRVSLLKEKNKYDDILERFGKGIVFHSTPSNVPVNFAFSFAAGLLAGNSNIIRLPAKEFPQVSVICDAINELASEEFSYIQPYVLMAKFPTVRAIIDSLSAIADARVIWGGDQTIANIRQSALKPRANEITFSDRHSILIINADFYLSVDDKAGVVRDFYNDTYFSDQNACTSPAFVFWIGNNIEAAKVDFWERVENKSIRDYPLSPVQAVGKLSKSYQIAACSDVTIIKNRSNHLTRVELKALRSDIINHKYNSGFFLEYSIRDITEILPVCSDKCQTITYLGLNKEDFETFISSSPKGVDRIVPMGKSMDFSLVWDGHDLIRELSRKMIFQ
ncbi:hypothetical protein Pcaca04_40610 [Pectobacterium carotovorum subsp. carotovorum]|nr:hypothetical protein Pcaca04_40610 [Pectobacterium carotovorum subsp. carotovorum]